MQEQTTITRSPSPAVTSTSGAEIWAGYRPSRVFSLAFSDHGSLELSLFKFRSLPIKIAWHLTLVNVIIQEIEGKALS
jgi:hypothetical protein